MSEKVDLRVSLVEEGQPDFLKQRAARSLGVPIGDISNIRTLRRSIDARKSLPVFNYRLEVYFQGEDVVDELYQFEYKDIGQSKEVHIVGFGPAGMFAALRCLEMGYKPVVFERGKNVRDRRRDLRAINQLHLVNEDSNYCFGEGGAGTYSDGKLYTRSHKRGDVRRILDHLVHHGATKQILIDAHPHIGTNKLPQIVQNIRETIISHGGEIYFESRMTDLSCSKDGRIESITLQNGKELKVDRLILATGHSARDVYHLLKKRNIAIKPKSFAMGIRVEHPQQIIDSIQYHCKGERHEKLPAASYQLVHQVEERGVYSFCMCPGGFIVPSATAAGEIVVNGMSPSKRNSPYANSGIVVEINAEEDLEQYREFEELKGLQFQKELEQNAFMVAGETQAAPAQRLTDFVERRNSADLNPTSYQPGLVSLPLHEILPGHLRVRLQKAFTAFGKKMKGYLTAEANIVGVESRTSSPVNIPRNQNFEHVQIQGLFPCGEGAGYAGGIVSAAMDGERCAEASIAGL